MNLVLATHQAVPEWSRTLRFWFDWFEEGFPLTAGVGDHISWYFLNMLQGSWSSSPPKIPICPGTLCPERKVNHGVALQPGLAPLTDDRSKTDSNNKHLHHIFTHIIYGGHLWTKCMLKDLWMFFNGWLCGLNGSYMFVWSCHELRRARSDLNSSKAPESAALFKSIAIHPVFDAVYFDAGVSESAEQLER